MSSEIRNSKLMKERVRQAIVRYEVYYQDKWRQPHSHRRQAIKILKESINKSNSPERIVAILYGTIRAVIDDHKNVTGTRLLRFFTLPTLAKELQACLDTIVKESLIGKPQLNKVKNHVDDQLARKSGIPSIKVSKAF